MAVDGRSAGHRALGGSAHNSSRRAPDPNERLRDAERSRQRILAAALSEFAEKGFAGARVRAIAERAGVNSQLISYYFGGKEGLYDEIMRRWREQEAQMERRNAQHGLSFADLVDAYVSAAREQPELIRVLVWDGLNQTTPASALKIEEAKEPPEVADLRGRQASGEIAADLDPAYLLIAIMGAAVAPVTIPQQIEHLCGVRADSPEFFDRYSEQIRLLLRHMSGTPRTEGPENEAGG